MFGEFLFARTGKKVPIFPKVGEAIKINQVLFHQMKKPGRNMEEQ